VRLDPRNAELPNDLGGTTYIMLRRYADAVRAFDRALTLAPDLRYAAAAKGLTYVIWKGDLDSLRSVLNGMPVAADLGEAASVAASRALLLLWERKADSLLVLVRGAHGGTFEFDEFFQPDLYAAWAHRLRGDERAARAAYASALAALAGVSDATSTGFCVHAQRGAALAGLGRRAEALKEVRWLRESRTCREDKMDAGPAAAEARAVILAQLGDADAAVKEIEPLLAGPSWLSVHTLRLDPRWDPIRQHPRFKALLVKYADPEKWVVH
jgi:serine/threonine-protein kinase